MKVTQDMVDQAEAEYALSFDMRKALSSALEDVPSNSITAYLDAILADRGARNRIIMAAKAAERAEEHRMWSGVEGRESKHGNPEQALVSGVIAALKQEVGR